MQNLSNPLLHQKGSQVPWHPKMFRHQKYLRQRKECPSSCQCTMLFSSQSTFFQIFQTEEFARIVNAKGMITFSLTSLILALFVTFFPWRGKRRVFSPSSRWQLEVVMLQRMQVTAFPPNDGCNIRVSFLSLYEMTPAIPKLKFSLKMTARYHQNIEKSEHSIFNTRGKLGRHV